MHPTLKQNDSRISLPALGACELTSVFTPELFADVDSNIAAWLPSHVHESEAVDMVSYQLLEPLDNSELVEAVGGMDTVAERCCVTPAHIRALVAECGSDEAILQRNGYQNLFFVTDPDTQTVYLLGVVYDPSVTAWVPYIYRLRNLYRAWSRGNRLFIPERI